MHSFLQLSTTSHFLGRVLLSSVFYQPFSEAAIMFVGLREVGWVGPEQEAVYGGCCSWLGIPHLILSHDSHPGCYQSHPHSPLASPTPALLRILPVWTSGDVVCQVVQPLPAPPLLVAVALVAGSRPWRHPQPGSGGSEAGRAEMAAC